LPLARGKRVYSSCGSRRESFDATSFSNTKLLLENRKELLKRSTSSINPTEGVFNMYKKILLAVDGSEHSLRATEEVSKIASIVKDRHIEIVLVAEFSKAKDEILHSQGKEELEVSRRKKRLPAAEQLKSRNLANEINILYIE